MSFDQPPIMENNRVLVPIRTIFEALGYTVNWDGTSQTGVADNGVNKVTVKIGSNQITYNGGVYTCDVAPKIISGRILVPVRAISESSGCQVEWVGESKTVSITSPIEGDVNVYAGPGDNYVLTGIINEDDIDKYVKEEGDWIEVEYGKRRGYIQESELNLLDKSNLPYVSDRLVSGPNLRPTIIYFDGYSRELTGDVSVYSGPSDSYSFQDTIAKYTNVTILHESTNNNSALDTLNPILLIEYEASNGLKRGYAYKNDVLDLDNPLRDFDSVKESSAAFSYDGKIYYSTIAYSHALDGWKTTLSDSDGDFQFNLLNAVTGVIGSNEGTPSLQQEVWLYNSKADANVPFVPGESSAKSMAILDLIMMAGDFVAAGSDVFSIQFDLETCKDEGRLLIRAGSPFESPYAGKENVVLSTLLMSRYPGTAKEKADAMIRDICPEIKGSEKCDLRMSFSKDFDLNPFGYSLLIDKNGKVYAQTIIHPGTEFKIYQGNEYIGDLAPRLANSLVELDDSTAARVIKILANNGINLITNGEQVGKPEAYEYGNTNGNILNQGLVAEKDGWIYYADTCYDGLYKERTDGSQRTKLSDDYCQYINVVGDWVYYSSFDGVYRVKTDGSGKERILNERAYNLIVVDDEMYFVENPYSTANLYKANTDGSGKELLLDNVDEFSIADGWIFYNEPDYSSNYRLYKIRTDGSQRTLVKEGLNWAMYNIICDDGWVYYTTELSGMLYKVRYDGSDYTEISIDVGDPHILSFNVADGRVYYNDFVNFAIQILDTDGNKLQTLQPVAVNGSYNVTSEWLYYYSNGGFAYRVNKDNSQTQQVAPMV